MEGGRQWSRFVPLRSGLVENGMAADPAPDDVGFTLGDRLSILKGGPPVAAQVISNTPATLYRCRDPQRRLRSP